MNGLAKYLFLLLIFVAVCLTGKVAFAADPGPDSATCAISVTVGSVIEWEGANFAAIDLDAQEAAITAKSHTPEGSAAYTLWTNCNLELSGDNTATAQLTDATDTLITKYKISTDGDGSAATGAAAAAVTASSSDVYTVHGSFLSTALAITHFNSDGSVEVTLEVEASNEADSVADSGSYTATQTITATWTSDN
ncbi:MAG: hypothetical protein KAR47_09255 [Planctomycetes bacterium]|nr:hypothetical protein [Planctomycetota bacterium]